MHVELGEPIVNEDYVRWLNNPAVTRYLEHAGRTSIAELRRYIKEREKDSFLFGIYADGTYVGNIKAGPLDWKHKHADVGIMIGEPDYWGKGVGTAAINLITDYAFTLGMHVLTAGIIEGNIGSLLAFLKAGYQWWGQFPEYRWFESEWRTEWFMAKINNQH